MLPKFIKSAEEACEFRSKQILRTHMEYECDYFIGLKYKSCKGMQLWSYI